MRWWRQWKDKNWDIKVNPAGSYNGMFFSSTKEIPPLRQVFINGKKEVTEKPARFALALIGVLGGAIAAIIHALRLWAGC